MRSTMPTTYHIPLKYLQPIHMKIIELYLKCWKQKDIASELGVSCSTVSHTLRDPISQEIIKKIMKENLQKSMQVILPED
jgi:DNA-binding NarL/FixJ family response regulator